jgi:hypothetical protein
MIWALAKVDRSLMGRWAEIQGFEAESLTGRVGVVAGVVLGRGKTFFLTT